MFKRYVQYRVAEEIYNEPASIFKYIGCTLLMIGFIMLAILSFF